MSAAITPVCDVFLKTMQTISGYGYCPHDFPNISAHFSDADNQLFSRISHNATHALKPFLPTHTQHSYNLRDRRHNFLSTIEFTAQSPAFYYQTILQIFLRLEYVCFTAELHSCKFYWTNIVLYCIGLIAGITDATQEDNGNKMTLTGQIAVSDVEVQWTERSRRDDLSSFLHVSKPSLQLHTDTHSTCSQPTGDIITN